MKKVLIITYLPYATPRIPGLAKYLPEFGWQPIIMTPHCSQAAGSQLRIIETPYRDALGPWKRLLGIKPGDDDIRKQVKERFGISSRKSPVDSVLTVGGAIINYPDAEKGWKPFAISEGGRLLQEENISAIISSSSPVTSHLVARELKTRYKIPWVADFRDLWSQNHNYSYGPFRRLIDRRLELKTLAVADALVTVSQPWAEQLETLHKGKLAHTITHGFDPEEVNDPPAKLTAKFTITYTGTVYSKYDPSKLFAALKDLISEGTLNPDGVEVRFYGKRTEWLDKKIEQYGLSSTVKQHGLVSKKVVFDKQRESQLLLILKWENQKERGSYSGKIFEYLGAKRPILATGGSNDVVSELLEETGAGVSAPTLEGVKSTLKELYREYKLQGRVCYKGDDIKVNKYSNRETAKKLSEILSSIVQRNS